MAELAGREGDMRPSLILACGALAKEILVLRDQLGVGEERLKLHCLPADLHNRPAEIAPRVEDYLAQHRKKYGHVLIGYGDCGTCGALDKVLARYDAQRLPHAHCYEFFATSLLFTKITEREIGSFFVTDYLVRHFDRLVIAGLGLDRYPHLRDTYFEHYNDLVYLAQTDTAMLRLKAQEAADRLQLNYVYREVGYGELEPAVRTAAYV